MYKRILNSDQLDILPLIAEFKRSFYLVGGTAIALQIGHRRSIDFDLFRNGDINSKKILDRVNRFKFETKIIRNVAGHLDLIVNNVKVTFFNYPFVIDKSVKFERIIQLPPLIDLASMKAYALGRRAKWKDYVDSYFLLKDYFTVEDIALRASEIFGDLFSEKLYRAQLSYFEGVDYSEKVEFIIEDIPTENEIKDFLVNKATDI